MSDYINTENVQSLIKRRDKIIKNFCTILNIIIVFTVLYITFYLNLSGLQWGLIQLHSIVVLIITLVDTENRLLIIINPRMGMLNRLIRNNNFLNIGEGFLHFKGSYVDYLKKIESSRVQADVEHDFNWTEAENVFKHVWLNSVVIITMILVSLVSIFVPLFVMGFANPHMVLLFYMFSYFWRVMFIIAVDMILIIFETKELIRRRDTISLYIYTKSYFTAVFSNGFWSLFRLEKLLFEFDKMISNNLILSIDAQEMKTD